MIWNLKYVIALMMNWMNLNVHHENMKSNS